ncbi:MAG: YceI family protein [Myxococcota bacterium]|nr:YceI family protein [Myxococcota bacterium]
MRRATCRSVLWFLCLAAAGCQKQSAENLAPAASALAPAKPAAPKAVTLEIDRASSQVKFLMEAAIEKISGEAPASIEGQLFVDLEDISKSTGLVKVDLEQLTLYQEQRKDEKQAFGEKKKNDLQNQHARTWLEISADAPDDVRKANRFAEFKITRLENASKTNLTAPGEHRLTATVVGDFRLHGRKSEKRADVAITLENGADKLDSLSVKTTAPLTIGLEEFDVRPREAFGKLAQKTLDALGSKVAKQAPLELSFTARAK